MRTVMEAYKFKLLQAGLLLIAVLAILPAAHFTPASAQNVPFIVALDPGHGGRDGGAVGLGGRAVEKDITLAVVKQIKEILEAKGGITVVLTRSDDSFVRLSDRVKIARNAGANLFISLHADSFHQRSVRGGTIYTQSKRASDRFSQQLADEQNKADLKAGLLPQVADEQASDILIDLARMETKGFSRRFALALRGELKGKVNLMSNPLRSAGFVVLSAPDMASVLFEMGYLSNEQDARELVDEAWRLKLAQTIAGAIYDYRTQQQIAGSQ